MKGSPPISAPGSTSGGSIPSSATELLKQTLKAWGLDSLLGHVQEYLTSGYDSSTITLALQDTKEYKTRFAGNELRKAAGLPVLSPAQYIATEEQYRNVMTQYGLPKGFYDKPDDLAKWIGGDVSPTELDERAKTAQVKYLTGPAENRQVWKDFYGLDEGHAVAAILDPQHESLAALQRMSNTVDIGGAARQQGLQVGLPRAQQFTDNGVTLSQAQKAYSQIAQYGDTLSRIGSRFGQPINQATQENAMLLNDGNAQKQIDAAAGSETALFGGHAAADANSGSVSTSY